MGAAARFELSTISHGNRDPTTEIHETVRMRFPEQSNVETPRNDILKFKGIVPSIEGMNTIIWSDSDLLIQIYIYIYIVYYGGRKRLLFEDIRRGSSCGKVGITTTIPIPI